MGCLLSMGWSCKSGPIVETINGPVEGSTMQTLGGKTVFAFRGVPYARPPLAELRFKKPEPVLAWTQNLNCKKEPSKSLQPFALAPECLLLAEGGEDCLYLSVFTKSPPGQESDLLPVVVFLPHGAFQLCSIESDLYGPQVLLDHDVVLVGVNYRVGPLGWLSLGCDEAPGNLGLWDQQMALVWVQNNIAAFGGDPKRVTLMGESAGAMSAMLHMVAPPSKGLFHRVVALSGTPSNLILKQSRRPEVFGKVLAEKFGCSKDADNLARLKKLQEAKATEILKNGFMFKDWDNTTPLPWVPVDDSGLTEPFLPLNFWDAVKAGRVEKVPILMACCKDEGLILSAPFHRYPSQADLLNKEWESWAPLLFFGRERQLPGKEDQQIVREVRARYWPNNDMGASPADDLVKIKDIFSFSSFLSPLDTDSQLLAESGLPVFTFLLNQPTAFSLATLFTISLPKVVQLFVENAFGLGTPDPLGVGHGDDLGYIFPMSPCCFPKMVVNEAQKRTRKNLLELIESFAGSGQPRTKEGGDMQRAVGGLVGEHLEVGEQLAARSSSPEMAEQLHFWRKLRERANQTAPPISDQPPHEYFAKNAIDRQMNEI